MDTPIQYPCIDHGKKLEELKQIADDTNHVVNRMAIALLGDEHLGVPGVVKTQGNHEARIRRIEKWAVYVFGVGGGLIIAWKFLSAAIPAIGAFLSGK